MTTRRRDWMQPKEVAEMLGVSPVTLRYWRMISIGPPYVRLSERRFLYDERDVLRYIDERRIDPSARAATRINHACLP